MSDTGDDPALLFTPPQGASKSDNADENPSELFLDTPTRPGKPGVAQDASTTRVYVEVPRLSDTELAKYQPLEEVIYGTEVDADKDSQIEEIEGEYILGNKRFLFARYGDGIVRRKEDWEYRTTHPDLYDDYTKKKEEGKLPKFDPNSVRIPPRHRIAPAQDAQKRKPGPVLDKDYVSDSDSTDESEQGSDSDDYVDTYVRRSTRATRNQSTRQVRALPYSPRKTRSGGGRQSSPINVSDSDESNSDQSVPRRRSSRKLTKKYTVNDDSDYENDGAEESSDYTESRSRHKAKQPIKRKGPKPAYGLIRKVEYMYDSDQETAPLRGHREECEKCRRASSHILMKRFNRRFKPKKKRDDLSEDEEELADRLGGWVRCLKCCVAAHWGCLSRSQQLEILKAARAKAEAKASEDNDIAPKIKDLDYTETTEFVCGSCSKGGICMICLEVAVESEQRASHQASSASSDAGKTADGTTGKVESEEPKDRRSDVTPGRELLFRCNTCKRLAHYSHLPVEDDDLTSVEIAQFYQKQNNWQCGDCASYIFRLDKIVAWRPFPANASDKYMSSPPEEANYKESLPREYLVKWVDRSYRRAEWVPHMWLVATHYSKLKNFYLKGPGLPLLTGAEAASSVSAKENANDLALAGTEDENSRATSAEIGHTPADSDVPPPPMLDAESRIPQSWKTIDRVLDVLLWAPRKKGRPQKKTKSKKKVEDHDSETEASPEAREEFDRALDYGDEPSEDVTETIAEFESRTGEELGEEHIERVIWAFVKWDDLLYEESTWDSPPRPGTPGYVQFEHAFKYFIQSRKVFVRKKNASEIAKFEERTKWSVAKIGVPHDGLYDIGQADSFRLMPFQVEGVNWLCRNWFHHQQCILADEMGLGKTVQIITFLGLLHARMNAFPCLVVVPNSTISNWVREFTRWAPRLRVVPFYGEQKSRDIIKQYELVHPTISPGTTGAKYHILVTTYESVTSAKEFNAVFKKCPRWEVLVVDEGQRLKSDTSLLFKRLNELNSALRVIMTGTPLNNNIRELFNLMNFLDRDKWSDLEALTKEFEELDEERVKELHERLRPYFLRRVKSEVLDLPAKNEVIVPVSMAPLQKEIYKSILSKNLDILSTLIGIASTKLHKSAIKASNLRNILMQLRKCLQHPYLVADDIEPKGLSPMDAHLKLIDASGKLRLLKILLPKLKARGHRILLFSQFVIGLDIIEDFLQGEGYKFLRLDGNTKQADRQKAMDEFNKEHSDVFIFILSTRAGGVGINLWSADTVIIFDPDFNPHQDLQAIARAHRYGQKKTCLVFKLMTKNSAEEKIIQAGKKKLVLDHLIVQKMDDDEDSSEVQSILTFGAKALFEEGAEADKDITYTESDIDTLIEKVESEEIKETTDSSNNAFSFAKVWSAQKDDLDDLPDEVHDDAQGDSWAQTLQKIALEKQQGEAREKTGRGARRKAALATKKYYEDANDAVSPDRPAGKGKKRQQSITFSSSDDDYNLPRTREASVSTSTGTNTNASDTTVKRRKLETDIASGHPKPLSSIMNRAGVEQCGLCLTNHGPGQCFMTDNSQNLVEYRKQLIHSEEESYGERLLAIRAIDETLSERGVLHLITGQPSKPLVKRPVGQSLKLGEHTKSASNSSSNQNRSSFNGHISSKEGHKQNKIVEIKSSENNSKPSDDSTRSFKFLTPITALKRDASPTSEHPVKKAKVRLCEICRGPYHLPVHCPIVAEGPASILKAIVRLSDGGNPGTLTALRSILRKQRKALETSGETDSPHQTQTTS